MFERLTDRARQTIVEAQSEAVEQQHNFIGTEHLLIGLLRVDGGLAHHVLSAAGVELEPVRQKVAARLAEWVDPNRQSVSDADALASIGIDLEAVKANVESAFGPGALPDPGAAPPFTRRAKEALEQSLLRARLLRHRFIGTEHLLLGVLDAREGVACQALGDIGADLDDLDRRVIELAAPEEARMNLAWRSITELRRTVDGLPAGDRERAAPVLADLAQAHGAAIGVEQADVARLATRAADALEAAVGAAKARLGELGLAT